MGPDRISLASEAALQRNRAQGRIRATHPLVIRVNPKSLGGPGLIPVIPAYGKSKHSQDTDRGQGRSGETICRKRIFASS
jgi:hypothetical protein